MDKIEKEWFDLVRSRPPSTSRDLLTVSLVFRRLAISRSGRMPCRAKTANVPFATTASARTRMRSSSATDATWRSTKVRREFSRCMAAQRGHDEDLMLIFVASSQIATAFRTSRKDSGSAANAPSRPTSQSCVSVRGLCYAQNLTIISRRPACFAPTRTAPSNKRQRASGHTCSARSGFPKQASATRCIWSRSTVSRTSPRVDGSW